MVVVTTLAFNIVGTHHGESFLRHKWLAAHKLYSHFDPCHLIFAFSVKHKVGHVVDHEVESIERKVDEISYWQDHESYVS